MPECLWKVRLTTKFPRQEISWNYGILCSAPLEDTVLKWSFPLRISLVNVTGSAGNCGIGHIYWGHLYWKTSFFVQWRSYSFLRRPVKYMLIGFSDRLLNVRWLAHLVSRFACKTRMLVDANSIPPAFHVK